MTQAKTAAREAAQAFASACRRFMHMDAEDQKWIAEEGKRLILAQRAAVWREAEQIAAEYEAREDVGDPHHSLGQKFAANIIHKKIAAKAKEESE